MGYTRMQNIDVEKLAKIIRSYHKTNPHIKIAVIRDTNKSF
jgi:hypothetical protein